MVYKPADYELSCTDVKFLIKALQLKLGANANACTYAFSKY